MNVERTMEFILASQAKAEVRMEKIDKRIEGITKIMLQGMRMLVRIETAQRRTEANLAQLSAAQKTTDAKFVDSQKRTDAKLADSQRRTNARFAELAELQRRTDAKFAELAELQRRTDARFTELAQAQKETQRSLKAFIDSLRHGRNGR